MFCVYRHTSLNILPHVFSLWIVCGYCVKIAKFPVLDLMVAGGRMGRKDREFRIGMYTLPIFKMNNQQAPVV